MSNTIKILAFPQGPGCNESQDLADPKCVLFPVYKNYNFVPVFLTTEYAAERLQKPFCSEVWISVFVLMEYWVSLSSMQYTQTIK